MQKKQRKHPLLEDTSLLLFEKKTFELKPLLRETEKVKHNDYDKKNN